MAAEPNSTWLGHKPKPLKDLQTAFGSLNDCAVALNYFAACRDKAEIPEDYDRTRWLLGAALKIPLFDYTFFPHLELQRAALDTEARPGAKIQRNCIEYPVAGPHFRDHH